MKPAVPSQLNHLSTKVNPLHLANDLNKLPPPVGNSATKTQGLVTSLNAEFSKKCVPNMNRLQAMVPTLRQWWWWWCPVNCCYQRHQHQHYYCY